MDIQNIITKKDLRFFKRQAKILVKEVGIKHTEALEVVAKRNHFNNWNQIVQHYKKAENLNNSQNSDEYTLEDFFNSDIEINNSIEHKKTFHLKIIDGAKVVLVKHDGFGNPETLTPKQDLYPYTGSYSWGYKGSGVLNLAYAVLGNCLVSDTETIEKNVIRFVEEFLSELDSNTEHVFSESEIISFLQ